MDKLYWLEQIKLLDRAEVGDKAFYLSRIMQRGYPVLSGFVIPASVLREFLENLNSSEALIADLPNSSLHLDVGNWRQLQQVAERLRQEIISATVSPELLTAISQATQTWETQCLIFRPSLTLPPGKQGVANISGLLESQICHCELEAIASALKQTWSQLFRARSLLCWQQAGIDLQQIKLAVLVQPIHNALASGLVNTNSSHWEIQASFGLGIAIAHGEVLPDVYYIQPETSLIQEQQLGYKLLAYRINNENSGVDLQSRSISLPKQDDSSLQVYLLTETQQQAYALPEEYLQQLIRLTNQLVKELGKHLTLEWTISQQTSSRTLYITQISLPQSGFSDIHFIKGLGAGTGRITASAHVIHSHQKPEQLPKGVILVAPAITPSWLPILQQVAGIITEHGGLTSHAAILARELGIPAVVNAASATTVIHHGEQLLIDGDKGEIYRLNTEEQEEETNKRQSDQFLPFLSFHHHTTPSKQSAPLWEATKYLQNRNSLRAGVSPILQNSGESSTTLNTDLHHNPTINHNYVSSTIDFSTHESMIATRLLVNLSQPSLIEQVLSLPIDGVGLLRSELMILNILEGQHPLNWLTNKRQDVLLERWYEQILQFAQAFAPRPVFYRSLDWRSRELQSSNQNFQSSPQSMLGERGTFSYLVNPAVFELELAALANVQQAGYTNIHLILPFVRTVEEFNFCRQKVAEAKLNRIPNFQLWIMAEVPSVLFLLPEYIKAGVQGISIGTNDLTQLLLGIDREQGQFVKAFDERHPAVMNAVAQLIHTARESGIPCSICGQAPALYPEIIDHFIKWGITSISVEPEAVARTYQAIARAEQRLILEAARRQMQ
ncbi:MAG: phosphoenolpyruvate synthase [Hapalosiphonaceae cyanobacterium JJU2]|nr:MAG: phosphoenolpyruvate synthase [Hapalosiphonaceae cyanobacterium JJU2]